MNARGTKQVMRLVLWMQRQRREVTVEAIQAEFGVARSTAYRWLLEWREARVEDTFLRK